MDKLLAMKPGNDFVWAAVETAVFKTYAGYFGYYLDGDPNDPWPVKCIKGTSPTVFKPRMFKYVGRFDMYNSGTDYLFVFSGNRGDNLCFSGIVMPWYSEYRVFADAKNLSGKILSGMFNEKRVLHADRAFFNREDCAARCRELNASRVGNFGHDEKWYEKTLENMQTQLRECFSADYVVDPVEKLKNTVAGEKN